MGLDMYLTGRKFFWRTYGQDVDRQEDGKRVTTMDVELGYWRKHPNLHGFMVQTFGKGKDDCKEIELSAEDLRAVIHAVEKRELPPTEGFFFGKSSRTTAERDNDLKVLREALDWLEAGDKDPFETETMVESSGFTATAVKLKEETKTENKQRMTRSVHYRGDW